MVDNFTIIYAFYFIYYVNNNDGGENLKKIKNIFIFCLILMLIYTITPLTLKAKRKTVLLGGDTIGLKLNTGVYVVGKYQVATKEHNVCPWQKSDVLEGDKILAYDNQSINTNQDLQKALKNDKDTIANLKIERNNQVFSTNVDVVTTKNNEKSIGLYIKDKILGIGTLTFIDQEKQAFASLGHGIYDNYLKTGHINGILSDSYVNSVIKSTPGTAGEKRASLVNESLGVIMENKISGIYGKMTTRIKNKKEIEIGTQDEVVVGPAKIYTVISGDKIESFDIKITDVNLQNSSDIKGLKYEVTDQVLLNKTGGIIQGMSGSPIVQNNKIIGAVSHVIVDNPKTGYGIHIEWMIEDLNQL